MIFSPHYIFRSKTKISGTGSVIAGMLKDGFTPATKLFCLADLFGAGRFV